jgi:hypothetical protein
MFRLHSLYISFYCLADNGLAWDMIHAREVGMWLLVLKIISKLIGKVWRFQNGNQKP